MNIKKFIILSLLVLSLFASAGSAFASGEVLVLMKNGTPVSSGAMSSASRAAAHKSAMLRAESAAQAVGATTSQSYAAIANETGQTIVLISSKTKTTDELIAGLKSNPNIASVVPNNAHKVLDAERTPNDPKWGDQWGQKRIGAAKVWDKCTGSKNVYVAVLDTGVMYDHPDLAANMCGKLPDGTYGKMFHRAIDSSCDIVPGSSLVTDITRGGTQMADTTSSDADILSMNYATVGDVTGHGTHVAGIIGAVGNNSLGVAGVNWNVKIIPVGVFTQGHHTLPGNILPTYSGAMNYDSDLIAGFDYVVWLKKTSGLKITAINISLGDWMKKDEYNFDQNTNPVAQAIKAASDAGIIVCIAAGNEFQNIDSPGPGKKCDCTDYFEYPATFRFENTLSIGASTSADKKASFSNYSTSGKWVDIFAPGAEIMSAVPYYCVLGETRIYSRSGCNSLSGTSMAAPMVAGTAALLTACYPNKTAEEIKAMIVNGAESDVLKNGCSKYGLINVWNSYQLGGGISDSGGSGGCSAGFGALALMLALPLVIFKRKKKKP